MFPAATLNSIPERWYHRLTTTFIVVTSILLFGGALMVLLPKAFYYRYEYSFENPYASFSGKEFNCTADADSHFLDCGSLTPEDFISRYLKNKGHYFTTTGTKIHDTVTMYREKGLSDFQISKAIIEQNPVYYKKQKVSDKPLLVRGGALSLGLAVAYFLLNIAMYKTVLYILHGHTTVTRVTDEEQVSYPKRPLPPI